MPRPTSTGTLGLGQDHVDLRDSVRALVARHITDAVVRDAVEATTETRPAFWSELAEQGLLGLHLPEEHGGAGFTLLETAVVAEELGRAMAPGPFLPTVIVSAVLARAGGVEAATVAGLADGTLIAGLALEPGTLTGQRTATGELRVTGTSVPALSAAMADVVLVPVTVSGSTASESELVWVLLGAGRFHTPETLEPSHDLTRRVAPITVEATLAPADVLAVDPWLPREIAATLAAAEASGLADWATWTGAEYARVREQFGRAIGQFQGVKHRLAWMLGMSERARVCAWDAARSWESDPAAESSWAAAVAAVLSIDAGFSTAKDCLNTLGGIGYTWEHDTHLYLRRAQTLRLLLGSATLWHQRLADLALAGTRRELRVELPPESEQIRADVRAELAPARELAEADRAGYLAEHGYTAPHLPAPWGKGADPVTQLVIAEELAATGLRPHDMVIGNWVVPTLIEHGSEAQRARFVPPSLAGSMVWCQLFSEPGAGSDLAGLSTRAEKVEGGWRINGQKVWTSLARQADYGILLARTDAGVAKHRGLSYFLLDMSTPGIDIRPLREITGEALFNEVFLDDVFIPDDHLVAQPGDGWKLARTTLANERVSMTKGSSLGPGGETLMELAGTWAATPQDPATAAATATSLTRLGRVLSEAHAVGLFDLRSTLRKVAGAQPGAESSVAKLLSVAHLQDLWETAVEWSGPATTYGVPQRRTPMWNFISTRNLSIAGGTTDVQLNIIAERILGLPRDAEPTVKA